MLEGTAEELPLASESADVASAGQAFHWFDVERALDEIARVLRPGGVVIAAWNSPPEDGTWYDAVIDFLHVANPDHLPARTARRAVDSHARRTASSSGDDPPAASEPSAGQKSRAVETARPARATARADAPRPRRATYTLATSPTARRSTARALPRAASHRSRSRSCPPRASRELAGDCCSSSRPRASATSS